jgi:uncharacterized repeat protein (TIGR03803 family)
MLAMKSETTSFTNLSSTSAVRGITIRMRRLPCALFFAALFTVTAVSPSVQGQTLTVLHSFGSSGGLDGLFPDADLTRDSAGNLYGTASYGGPANICDFDSGGGTVFKLAPSGKITVLHAFSGKTDGCRPSSGLVRDKAGNLYGTNLNIVYKITAAGKFSVFHRFADGWYPLGNLIQDPQGNLYGVTQEGGKFNGGSVYKLNSSGKMTILHSFGPLPDGDLPTGRLVRDSAGNLYGTTAIGGSILCITGEGCGTVFRVAPSGIETVLYSFSGGSDGYLPNGDIVRDAQGNLYGTTQQGGGDSCNVFGCGTIWKLDTAGNLTALHQFLGPDGMAPDAGLIRDASGNLYGTTGTGGDPTCGCGNVFKLDPSGNYTVLYNFTGSPDGASPFSGLAQDSAGNLYGATYYGGSQGLGSIFKLTP